MAERIALALIDGKISQVPSGDTIRGSGASDDFHSGYSVIQASQSVAVSEFKQMINFIMLTIDGDLTLDGDLWLA
jgi:hypothetical protein